MGRGRLIMASWTWAGASCKGTSHAIQGTRRQDALVCSTASGSLQLIAILCDGAGSASKGGEGASLVARSISICAREHFAAVEAMP